MFVNRGLGDTCRNYLHAANSQNFFFDMPLFLLIKMNLARHLL